MNQQRATRRALTGDRNQCPTCGEYFNSMSAFDKHRIGEFGTDRRCMTETEMNSAGMVKNAEDFWLTRARTQQSVSSLTRKAKQPRSEVGRYYPTCSANRGSNAMFAHSITRATVQSPADHLP
ncbi:hypothetical protein D9X30_1074 [Cupriavidus sp. U2]|uniref:hypothetical protein n=1 Tax=Cupriavidus sp. U2 TaxID=2920269 RepID=UPI00129EC2EB|nr:hypothetical protein [Cupriavidus sp. U2]KAI3593899.1 hypothetical protein D9X30_1074 [Cupriavidus sp. U2]